MTAHRKTIQLSLVTIGIFLIFATYFLYPRIIENKFLKEKTFKDDMTKIDIIDGKKINTFENVEYKGLYDNNKTFKVESKKAYILIEEPDIVHMTSMRVTLDMDGGNMVIITSDKGKYNKVTYDCFFENNVKALDGLTTVLAENMDLLSAKNSATVYNNVFLTNNKGSLNADKIYYDFETKTYQVSMFNDEKVKMKLIE